MKRRVLIAALALTACDQAGPPGAKPAAPTAGASAAPVSAQLDQLAKSNASVVGYLYSAETPYIVATFDEGTLIWRTQGGANAVAKGRMGVVIERDRSCVGFEQKNPTMPDRGPERYLVCEAVDSIKHSNSLPRSQDYSLSSGTLFLEYDPPPGTGYTQLFYAKRTK